MTVAKGKGVGPKALREALKGINEVSSQRRIMLPAIIEMELREKFPMKSIKGR